MIGTIILSALLAGTPYLSLKAGVGHLENHELHFEEHTYDKGVGVAGSLGYDLGWFRYEVELLHTRNKQGTVYNLDQSFNRDGSGTVSKTLYFVNGIFDVPIYGNDDIEGYVGAGYGFPRWQLLAGFKYSVAPKWWIDLGYRFVHEPYSAREYVDPHCVVFAGGVCSGPEPIYENHLITIGVTYTFR